MKCGGKQGTRKETNGRTHSSTVGTLLVSVLVLAAGIAGCAAGKTSLPAAEELSAAGSLPPGTDMEALRRGRTVLVTECTGCHRLFLPGEYSPEQWRAIVKRMAVRASLTGDQAADLSMYLSSASRAGK